MTAKAEMRFVFALCNDVNAIVHFYGNTLGVPVKTDPQDDAWCDVDLGIPMLFFKGDYELPINQEWAWQPGYKGGLGHTTSYSIHFSELEFPRLFDRLSEQKVSMIHPKPTWRRDSYWGMTVKDPMGTTLELYCVPKEKPASIEW